MRTEFVRNKDKVEGILYLTDKLETVTRKLVFNPKSMNTWYPLNISYSLAYQAEDNKLCFYLAKSTTSYDYRIYHRGENYYYSIPEAEDMLTIERVKKDNDFIIHLAHGLGVSTWVDDYTKSDVESGFIEVGNQMTLLTDERLNEYINNLSASDMVKYYELPDEHKQKLAFSLLSPTEARQYAELGKLYSMLSIMRKVVIAYDKGLPE